MRAVIVINRGTVIFDDTVLALKARFMRTRFIDLKLVEPGCHIDLPGVRVLREEDYAIALEVDTTVQRTEAVVSHIVATCAVADITIEDPPLEEIIAAIYGQG